MFSHSHMVECQEIIWSKHLDCNRNSPVLLFLIKLITFLSVNYINYEICTKRMWKFMQSSAILLCLFQYTVANFKGTITRVALAALY